MKNNKRLIIAIFTNIILFNSIFAMYEGNKRVNINLSINKKNENICKHNTKLILAVQNDDQDLVKRLIDKRINIDTKDDNGATALMYATSSNNVDIAKLLIDANANTDIKNKLGEAALDIAIKNNFADMIELLLASGSDIY